MTKMVKIQLFVTLIIVGTFIYGIFAQRQLVFPNLFHSGLAVGLLIIWTSLMLINYVDYTKKHTSSARQGVGLLCPALLYFQFFLRATEIGSQGLLLFLILFHLVLGARELLCAQQLHHKVH